MGLRKIYLFWKPIDHIYMPPTHKGAGGIIILYCGSFDFMKIVQI